MLNYPVYLRLRQSLAELSALSPMLKGGSGLYAEGAVAFLQRLQAFAGGESLYVEPDIALALQKISVFDGKAPRDGVRRSARKERDSYAAGCLSELQGRIEQFLDRYEKIYEESADMCRAIAAQIVSADPRAAVGGTAERFLAIAQREESLRPYYAHVLGVLGKYNLRAVFDSVLPQVGITN